MNSLIASIILAALFVPETTSNTIRVTPLQRGETAFVDNGDGTAGLLVGTAQGDPMTVYDPVTIHGYEMDEIDSERIAVVKSQGVTYTASNDRYTFANGASGTVYMVAFKVPKDYPFEVDDVTYGFHAGSDGLIDPTDHAKVAVAVEENVATFTITRTSQGGNVYLEKVHIRRVVRGSREAQNDLTKLRIPTIDTVGFSELGEWREWARDLYNGNRGEDWAGYKAKSRVRLDSNTLTFDSARRYEYSVGNDGLTLYAGGLPAIKTHYFGLAVSNAFDITGWTVNADQTCDLSYTFDKDEWTPSEIIVRVATTLANGGDWRTLSVTDYTITRTNVHITAVPNNSVSPSFFVKLEYAGDSSHALEIRLRGQVIIEDKLLIRGSGSDTNQLYRIEVINGTLTATAVNAD